MNDWITEADREYFRRRYPKTWKNTLAYAVKTATEYAEQHAPKSVQNMVMHLYLRYVMENDYGDKRLIRRAIDEVIAQGSWIDAHTNP